jgi:hypothetical protein
MNPYLVRLLVEAHRAELTAQAQQARLTHPAQRPHRRSNRINTLLAQMLVAVATRLDDQMQPRRDNHASNAHVAASSGTAA